jgi:hypothetical protein
LSSIVLLIPGTNEWSVSCSALTMTLPDIYADESSDSTSVAGLERSGKAGRWIRRNGTIILFGVDHLSAYGKAVPRQMSTPALAERESQFETFNLDPRVANICRDATNLAQFYGGKKKLPGRGVPQLNNLVNRASGIIPTLGRRRDIDTLVACVARMEFATGNRGTTGKLRNAAFRRMAELPPDQ